MMESYLLSSQQRDIFQRGASGGLRALYRVADGPAFETVQARLRRLVADHDILRTTFVTRPGFKMPAQQIHQDLEITCADQVDSAQDRELTWNLAAGPLLKVGYRQDGGDGHLELAAAAPLLDLFSLDLAAAALLFDVEPPEEITQYVQYSDWQNDIINEDDEYAEEGRLHWADRNTDAPVLPDLYGAAGTVGSRRVTFPAGLDQRVSSFAEARESTPEVVIFAALRATLARFGAYDPLQIGYRAASRDDEDMADMLGRFDRVLPTTTAVDAAVSFERLVNAIDEHLNLTGGWADFYESPENQNPICPLVFSYTPQPPDSRLNREFHQDPIGSYRLHFNSDSKGVTVAWSDLDPDTITGLTDSLIALLEDALAKPQALLRNLNCLSASASEQRRPFSAEPFERSSPVQLHRRFESHARNQGDRTALIFEGAAFTYDQLNRAANALAATLISHGAEPGRNAAIALPRGPEWIVAMLAVMKTGATFAPVDGHLPIERLNGVLTDLAPVAVISDEPQHFKQHTVLAVDLQADEDTNPDVHIQADDTVYALFTSGSTGKPKAVLLRHRQLANYTDGVITALSLEADTQFAHISTLLADLGHTMLFPALSLGGCLHLLSEAAAVQPDLLARTLKTHPADYLKIVPSHLEALLSADDADILPRKALVMGGEATSANLLAKIRQLAPDLSLFNHYGPTEACVGVLVHPLSPDRTYADGVPLGHPLANTTIQLLDTSGAPVPDTVPGELYISGQCLAAGYLNRPDLTDAAFITDESGVRWYKTGDIARFSSEGELFFMGRRDHQIKLHGFRIELGEIDHALRDHPKVAEAVVLLIQRGDNPALAAFVRPTDDQLNLTEVEAWCEQRLPHHMIPAVTVLIDRLPLTPNGKIDRKALEKLARQASQGGGAAPETPLQEILVNVWSKVLRQKVVGIHDNFFRLGGDSIISIQIMAKAKQEGVNLIPKLIFDNPTVAQLAEVLEREGLATPSVEEEPDQATTPLGPIQRWFFHQIQNHNAYWNMTFMAKPRFRLDPQYTNAACAAIFAHHDALRLIFPKNEAEAAYLPADSPFHINTVDLSGEADQIAALETHAARQQAGLDLETGPLFKVFLYDLGETQRLLLVVHHLVIDAVSWRILLDDFTTLYRQAEAAQALNPGHKSTSFQTHVRAQQRFALDKEADILRSAYLEPLAIVDFPVDQAGFGLEQDERAVDLELDETQTKTLLQEAGSAYATNVEELLLAALTPAVAAQTGGGVYLDLEGHGRDNLDGRERDLSRTVGWFTTHYPVFFTPTQDPLNNLRTVKDRLRTMPHKGLDFGVLRYLGTPESTAQVAAARPQPQMSFNYWGSMDHSFGPEALLESASENAGPLHHPAADRPYLLRFNAAVSGGRLKLSVRYPDGKLDPGRVQDLADTWKSGVLNLITTCINPEVGGYTAADFPLLDVDQDVLDQLTQELAGREASTPRNLRDKLEDIYPLSPIQQGILFHSTTATDANDPYFRQMSWSINGDLDVSAFRQAWLDEVAQHSIFRSSFLFDTLPAAVQIVWRQAEPLFVYEDWTDLDADAVSTAEKRLGPEEHARSFELDKPPLMRFFLIKRGPDDHRFVWSYHHLIMDGWSKYFVLNRVYARYRALAGAETLKIGPVYPFRNYVQWLSKKDRETDRAFWSQYLAGLEGATHFKGRNAKPAEHHFDGLPLTLTTEESDQLQTAAREQGLTLNTLVQTAWALVLGFHADTPDVIFGFTVSGRPPHLHGMDAMAGPFINSLPTRIRWRAEDQLKDLLHAVHQNQTAVRDHEHGSLVDIKSWSGLPQNQSLFESLVIFYNYPKDPNLGQKHAGLTMGTPEFIEESNFPIGLVAGVRDILEMGIRFNHAHYSPQMIQTILGHLKTTLDAFVHHADLTAEALTEKLKQQDAAAMSAARNRLAGARRGARRKPIQR